MPEFLDLFLHLDDVMGTVIATHGVWVYALLFLIIFCETGLVVTPFLPGDSLLFAAGTFAASGALDLPIVVSLTFIAAVLGDTVNYRIGRRVGANAEDGRLFGLRIRKEHLEKTRRYYERHGAKTIVLARFAPIIRTFAPFVAGVGAMPYATFFRYNLLGAALWVGLFVFGGYFFGNIPLIKHNFEIAIIAIVFISLLPAFVEFLRERGKKD